MESHCLVLFVKVSSIPSFQCKRRVCWSKIWPFSSMLLTLHNLLYLLLPASVVFSSCTKWGPNISRFAIKSPSFFSCTRSGRRKGQLISKGPFAVFICTKKRTKLISFISALKIYCSKIILSWIPAPLKEIFFLFNLSF